MLHRFLTIIPLLIFLPTHLHALTNDGIPQIPSQIVKPMKKLQNTDPINLADYSASEGLIVCKRFKETMQIFRLNEPGGEMLQLTYDTNPIFEASVNPDSTRHCLLFEKDSDGNELSQLYKLDLQSHSIQRLTDGISQNGNCIWSNRGDRFAFASTMKNSKDWGIYLCSIDSPQVITPLLEKNGAWGIEDWAPDDSSLLISRYVSSNESQYFILNVKSCTLSPILGSDTEKVSLENGMWSKNSNGIFYTSDKLTEHRTLYYLDLITRRQIPLTSNIPWNVREINLSQNGSYISFSTNEHGFSKLYLMSLKDYNMQPMKNIPQGVILGLHFSKGDSLLFFTLNHPLETDAVYSVNIQSEKLTKWTTQKNPDVNILAPKIFSYPTFDTVNSQKRTIPCYYYKPSGKGPFPVVISIHGGPESQYWPYYSPTITYIVKNLHCAVLVPNVRGSNGYGKTWLSLDDGYKREDAVKDIGALLDWIETQASLDKSKIAVMGGSYGGYMSLASMVHYNGRLKAGIDLYGISNFITYMKKTRSSRVDLRRVEYGDERDSSMYSFLQKISPLTNAGKIKSPMLIIQGANDSRVPAFESEQIVNELKKNKIPVWFLLFTDEGHGFNKKNNKDYQENVVIYFLKKFLIE
jgi:dipeptidyl aminopeptidase/acylaminoacyl peptidase